MFLGGWFFVYFVVVVFSMRHMQHDEPLRAIGMLQMGIIQRQVVNTCNISVTVIRKHRNNY